MYIYVDLDLDLYEDLDLDLYPDLSLTPRLAQALGVPKTQWPHKSYRSQIVGLLLLPLAHQPKEWKQPYSPYDPIKS